MRNNKKGGRMSFSNLSVDHQLFRYLKEEQPRWWKNLVADNDIYIDIRKDNYISVYYNGGSIMQLSFKRKLTAQIHFEYIPIASKENLVEFEFFDEAIEINKSKIEILPLHNFDKKSLTSLKNRIKKFNPSSSEKAIQADFVKNNAAFIDTEFSYENSRIDLVWIDRKEKKIFFVELKTIGDERLYIGEEIRANVETIDEQLKKYNKLVSKYKSDLIIYYSKLFKIKKDLGLLKNDLEDLETLDGFDIEERPILLVGDCTKKWIKDNSEDINSYIKDKAFACFYQGRTTRKFSIPKKSQRNKYIFD